jgi:hypothetical protein
MHPAGILAADGTFCGVFDFDDLCAGDPACDVAAAWILLPDDSAGRFHATYRPAPDPAPPVPRPRLGPPARPRLSPHRRGRRPGPLRRRAHLGRRCRVSTLTRERARQPGLTGHRTRPE